MVLPRWLARTNRLFTNRLLGSLPRRWSPFAIVHHVGRVSGRHYSTPLAGFRTPRGMILTPTYGPEADWVQNLLAAGSFTVDRRGDLLELTNARLVPRAEAWPHLPFVVRLAMRALRVDWYVVGDRT